MKVNKGSLWIGKDWKEAIRLSLKTADCGVEEVYEDKYPDRLLDDEKVFVGYQIFGYGNRRKYTTRIPESLNDFVKELLNSAKMKIKNVTEKEAPLIYNIKDYMLNQNLRFYNGYYYSDFDKWNDRKHSVKDINNENLERFIKVNKKLYKKWCKKSELCITETGNTMFGDWWTMDVDLRCNKNNVRFNKKNFLKELEKVKKWIKKKEKVRNNRKINFSYPRIKWYKEV